MQDFSDKVFVVTGGASGIGSGICRRAAEAGANVVIADIDADGAAKLAEELSGSGVRAVAVRTDVTSRASVEALAKRAVDELGGVDVVCNNAGVYVGGPMSELNDQDWRWVLSVNLDGVYLGSQVFSKLLREQGRGGHIVNTASIGGFLSHGAGCVYATSKFAVVGFTEALRDDLKRDGIGVSILAPGPIRTNLSASDRLRPEGLHEAGNRSEVLWEMIKDGLEPTQAGAIVLNGIRNNLPYIFTHDWRAVFQERFDRVLAGFDAIPEV